MKRVPILWCSGFILGTLILTGCVKEQPIIVKTYTGHTAKLKMPPDVIGNDMDGKPLKLSDYRGKVVLVDFWATDCSPCVRQIPDIAAAYKKYHSRGFDVLGISMDSDMPKLRRFIGVKKIPWKHIVDPTGKMMNSIIPDGHGIPMTVLIGRDGGLAAADMPKAELCSAIERELARTS